MEKSFYITDTERMELFEFIIANNGKVIPKMIYNSKKYIEINDKFEFIDIINEKAISFFIVSDTFQLEPLVINKNDFIKENAYSFDQRKGGPYINIDLYRGFAEDALVKYKCTDIHYYSRYIHYNSSEEFHATEELKFFFNSIAKFLKSKCKVITIDNKKYYISKKIIEFSPATASVLKDTCDNKK